MGITLYSVSKSVFISKSTSSGYHTRIKENFSALSPTAMICRKVHFHMAESFDNVRISKFQNPFAGDKMMFDDGAAAHTVILEYFNIKE